MRQQQWSSNELMLKNLSSSTMKVMLHEHNIPLKQNMEKAKKLNMLIIFETSLKIKGRVSWTSCAVHSVQASKNQKARSCTTGS